LISRRKRLRLGFNVASELPPPPSQGRGALRLKKGPGRVTAGATHDDAAAAAGGRGAAAAAHEDDEVAAGRGGGNDSDGNASRLPKAAAGRWRYMRTVWRSYRGCDTSWGPNW